MIVHPPQLASIATFLSLFTLTHAANLAAWKSRSVYQTMTDRFARTDGSTTHACNTTAGLYCGGTWRGTINHLDYIQGMGFDAVMISPIMENIEGRVKYGEAYHGYWPLDLYSLNSHFGTHQDLLDLSDALHSRGMYLMMDTVINNMAFMLDSGEDPATDIDYSTLSPFNKAEYYHPYCKIEDWNNFTEAQLCQTGDDLVALPDLFTEHTEVQNILEKWANEMIKTYSIDGLRIDAAKHVDPAFLRKFGSAVDIFMTGEVLQREVDIICDYQDNYMTSMPNYPIYYAMLDALLMANTTNLYRVVETMKTSCQDVTALVSFSENHDQERIPNKNDDIAIAKNVLTFTMLFDGIPMIYQGQEQHLDGPHTPENREAIWLSKYNTDATLYKLLTKLNLIRKHAYKLGIDYLDARTVPVYRSDGDIAFKKGVEGRQIVTVLSIQSSKQKGSYTLTMFSTYNAGTQITDVLSCNNYTVANTGDLVVTQEKGEPKVFFPTELLEGSGLCGWPLENITFTELRTGEAPEEEDLGSMASRRMLPTALFSLVLAVAGLLFF
ncbi:glycoside hydrolase superfamily [Aspergillus karnatakaensis]|uniref:alpha-amylase n=1 Tax=Aspergillus karnatakaensis TaxID=1810916 RepID=UPI003CCD079F